MRIVLFGSRGMIGSRIALEQRGHDLTGASRSTGADITDPQSVAGVAAGADAVVSAVSARGVSYTLAYLRVASRAAPPRSALHESARAS
jgi:putative NADH-flavin reductase